MDSPPPLVMSPTSSSSSTTTITDARLKAALDKVLYRHYSKTIQSTTGIVIDSNDYSSLSSSLLLQVPGVQVSIVSLSSSSDSNKLLYSNAIGASDPIRNNNDNDDIRTHHDNDDDDSLSLLTSDHKCNLYSVTKFFTACCILKLIELDNNELQYNTKVQDLLPNHLKQYVNDWCTIGNLLTHTAGVLNPMPLSWVHILSENNNKEKEQQQDEQEKEQQDEQSLLEEVLKKSSFHKVKPTFSSVSSSSLKQQQQVEEGLEKKEQLYILEKAAPYKYSNVGYWILGYIITKTCGEQKMEDFDQCCYELLFSTLKEEKDNIDIDSKYYCKKGATDANNNNNKDSKNIAPGYIRRYSMLSLAGWLFCPPYCMGIQNSNYIRMNSHTVYGSAYGGLFGSSNSVAIFLQHLYNNNVLSSKSIEILFQLPDTTNNKINKVMTLGGLHLRGHNGMPIYYKEGGGAGCHSTIHIRPEQQLAGCIIAGDAQYDVNDLLDELLDTINQVLINENNNNNNNNTSSSSSSSNSQQLLSLPKVQLKERAITSKDGTKIHTKLYYYYDNNTPTIQNEKGKEKEVDADNTDDDIMIIAGAEPTTTTTTSTTSTDDNTKESSSVVTGTTTITTNEITTTTTSSSSSTMKTYLLIHGGPGVPDYLDDLAMLMMQSLLSSSSQQQQQQMENNNNNNNNVQILCFDQRGVGRSSSCCNNKEITIDDMIQDIESIRLSYNIIQFESVIGHSWGGVLSRLYTNVYPQHVKSLVLLSPSTVMMSSMSSSMSNNNNNNNNSTILNEWSEMEMAVMQYNQFKMSNSFIKFAMMGLYSLGVMIFPYISQYMAKYCVKNLFTYIIKNYYYDPMTAPQPNEEQFLNGISPTAIIQTKNAFINYVNNTYYNHNNNKNNNNNNNTITKITTTTKPPILIIFGDQDIYGSKLIHKFKKYFEKEENNSNNNNNNFYYEFQILSNGTHLLWISQPQVLMQTLSNFYHRCQQKQKQEQKQEQQQQ